MDTKKKPRVKKENVVLPAPAPASAPAPDPAPAPPKKKRGRKTKEAIKEIEELVNTDEGDPDEAEADPTKNEADLVDEIKEADTNEKVYGYLIVQEFPHLNTTYVIGSKPFGKLWLNYTEVLEQFITILIDWQVDFDNKEIISSKKPRIVKVQIL